MGIFFRKIKKGGWIFLFLFLWSCVPQKSSEKKIVIWHWMNDRQTAFEELAGRYQKETGIEIEFKLFSPPDIYSQKVIAAARANNLPEIFGILGEKKTLASFVKAGYILDLTPYMEKDNWKDTFYPQALGVTIFGEANAYGVKPGIYAVPLDTMLMQFVYNKSLFREAGLDSDKPPLSFEEFITFARSIKEKTAKEGFVCGWGEGWLLNCLAIQWAINLMGEENFIRTLKGELPYTTKEWIDTFSLFVRLREAKILHPNLTTMINKEAEDLFSRGKAAFSFNGSWAVNVYKELGPDLDYGFFALPKLSDLAIKIWGGAGASFMINANSKHKEEAVKFLKWLTAREQQIFLIEKTNNLPAIKGCEEKLPKILKGLVKYLDSLTHPNLWPYNEDSRIIEIMNTGLQQIVMGLKNPQEVLAQIQKEKERLLRQ